MPSGQRWLGGWLRLRTLVPTHSSDWAKSIVAFGSWSHVENFPQADSSCEPAGERLSPIWAVVRSATGARNGEPLCTIINSTV